MHRNTYLVITFLAVFAALVVGVNLGHRMNNTSSTPTPVVSKVTTPTPVAVTTPSFLTYTSTFCGFSLQYPSTLTKMESASGSALLINGSTKAQTLAIACQKDIPRPPLPAAKMEKKILTDSV